MGFFSKIWKGVKKGFKKIFKPIKKVFKSIGKFMGKIGIVGQIALSFILPGIGTMLSGMLSNVVGSLAGGALGGIGEAAGWVLGKAHEFGKIVGEGYRTVTGAVTDFIGTAGKYVGGKLNIGTLPNQTLGQAFGKEGWGGRLSDSFSKLGDAATEFWDMDIKGSTGSHLKLAGTSPLREDPTGEFGKPTKAYSEALDPLDPESSFMQEQSKLFESNQQLGPNSGLNLSVDPDLQSSLSSYDIDPNTGASINERYSSAFSERARGQTPYSPPDSAAVTPSVQEQGLISKGLEALTGEETWKGAGSKMLKSTGESLLASPGKAVASTLTTGVGQAVGILPKPQGDPGPQWGGYTSPYSSQQYAVMPQQTQQMPSAFSEFTMGQSFSTDSNGSWLGNDYWADYMRRTQAFA